MTPTRDLAVLAVDLGATSVRVCRVDLGANPLTVDVVHRYAHGPVRAADGSWRWDWARIVAEVRRGLTIGSGAGAIASIGIDAWGVDYGLLNAAGALVAAPHSYRDPRTSAWRTVVDVIGEEALYRITGIQAMEINTIYQLAAHSRAELDDASTLLTIPELMVHELTGVATSEVTSASTTGLVDLTTGDWSSKLIDEIGVDPGLFAPIRAATSPAGLWEGVEVHLVGGHDTASAIVALPGPPAPGAVFVSTGTWILVGCERAGPDTSDAARMAGFSNEAGALGGTRFLKNVNGLWILEQCRERWGSPPIAELAEAAADAKPAGPHTFDATDRRFLAPPDMESEVRSAAGLRPSASRAYVVRCILESLARTVAAVIAELSAVTAAYPSEVHLVGGATRIALLNDLVANAVGMPVRIGSGAAEATSLGNALVQGIAIGRFETLDDARRALA